MPLFFNKTMTKVTNFQSNSKLYTISFIWHAAFWLSLQFHTVVLVGTSQFVSLHQMLATNITLYSLTTTTQIQCNSLGWSCHTTCCQHSLEDHCHGHTWEQHLSSHCQWDWQQARPEPPKIYSAESLPEKLCLLCLCKKCQLHISVHK